MLKKPYVNKNGVYFLNPFYSQAEKNIINGMCEYLEDRGFQYLSIPSIVTEETYERQASVPVEKVIKASDGQFFAGSAEQGILERYTNADINEKTLLYARNQCFRNEDKPYHDLVRVKEFIKVEQFAFCSESQAEEVFYGFLENACDYLRTLKIEHRIVDTTKTDKGYHLLKQDIEIHTDAHGWLETHSCSYFGTEQTRRFGIAGKCDHTVSNTGIASPRILIPLMELNGDYYTTP